jgi:hypothetical protein
MQVNPDAMLGSNVADIGTGVIIRHGESVITLPSGTVLETAKANGLNPEAYLNHLLTVLPERFAADPQSPVDDLMP